MRIESTCLVLADISGYTRFIRQPKLSLLHAEQIVTELLEAVIASTRQPLQLNKLEGDAVLMFTHGHADSADTAKNVAHQAEQLFTAFHQQQQRLIARNNGCSCDACSNIASLKLKVVLHAGEILIKRIRHFEELAGEPVILIHRLLKNTITHEEYLLMTDTFCDLSKLPPHETREEACDGFGQQQVHLRFPTETGEGVDQTGWNLPLAPKLRAVKLSLRARWNRMIRPRTYYNLGRP